MYESDNRVVMTLDAGGTNFVFSAIQGNREVVEPVHLPAEPHNIDRCLDALLTGFRQVEAQLEVPAAAVSFAFPGPADYEHGVIGDLPNFPAFRGGVALGPYLQEQLGMPVYINNDGNLFAYGEALAGQLVTVNEQLKAANNPKRYRNVVGITLGTGFGAGVVIDNVLLRGDNGCGGDVWLMQNKFYEDTIAEESVSIRAVKRVYKELTTHGDAAADLHPKDIFDIAEGVREGDSEAARLSFYRLGQAAGQAIVHALDIADGLVVIGGGVSGAAKYILPGLMDELRAPIGTLDGRSMARLQMEVYNLTDEQELEQFLADEDTEVMIPHSNKVVRYEQCRKTGVTVSALGTNRAVSLGAYYFALSQLDKTI